MRFFASEDECDDEYNEYLSHYKFDEKLYMTKYTITLKMIRLLKSFYLTHISVTIRIVVE